MAIKIPRGVWHGYISLENKSATLMYIMGRPYDPKDPDTQEKDVFAFGAVWTVKHGRLIYHFKLVMNITKIIFSLSI